MLSEATSCSLSADIIVVGAGIAGAVAASALARQGRRVLLVETHATCPPVFRAEKVERKELRMLGDLGHLESLRSISGEISEVFSAYNGYVYKRRQAEQIGISYAELVNSIRCQLPSTVEMKLDRVVGIKRDGELTAVSLAEGETVTARLCVLASGVDARLLSSIGLHRRVLQKEQCVVLGFDLSPADSASFSFDSLTCYPTDPAYRIDYLTLFRMHHRMRANIFTFLAGNDSWVREFHKEPTRLLRQVFPKLSRMIGDYHVNSQVVSGRVDLFRSEGEVPDGVVLIGDAFQNACPASGLGLKKVFSDIAVLTECVPEWFSTPGMGAEKLKKFYKDPRKLSMDRFVVQRASHLRNAVCNPSLRWQVYRTLVRLRRSLSIPRYLTANLQTARPRPTPGRPLQQLQAPK